MERIRQLRTETDRTIWVNNWPESLDDCDHLFSFRVSEMAWTRKLNVCLSENMRAIAGCELIDLAGLACTHHGSFFDLLIS